MDDLDLTMRGHRLSTSESIYALGKEYYKAMFEKTIDIDNIQQKRLYVHPLDKEEDDDKRRKI